MMGIEYTQNIILLNYLRRGRETIQQRADRLFFEVMDEVHRNDWAKKFVYSIYGDNFDQGFMFLNYFMGKNHIEAWGRHFKKQITYDYINGKAWVS